jgi:hypothetical protein
MGIYKLKSITPKRLQGLPRKMMCGPYFTK